MFILNLVLLGLHTGTLEILCDSGERLPVLLHTLLAVSVPGSDNLRDEGDEREGIADGQVCHQVTSGPHERHPQHPKQLRRCLSVNTDVGEEAARTHLRMRT